MDFLVFLRAVLALAVTLGLIGLAAFAVRKYAPELMARLQSKGGKDRRLKVVETLVVGPTHRIVLISVDEEERIVLLGDGRELLEPRKVPARPSKAAQ
jgi:flagellar protein FliO/FliZ